MADTGDDQSPRALGTAVYCDRRGLQICVREHPAQHRNLFIGGS